METKDFLHALKDDEVARAIADAEKLTSGEIRVFVNESAVENVVLEGEKQFIRMGMTKTAQRNGVLIYFAPKSQKFAVIGDEGVHKKCGQKFWEHITEEMTPLLKSGRFTEAITLAVRDIGTALAKEFPPVANDRNELPNRVARG
ncbi:MAG TPA: TPM domain-containing protein [Verrucomicrobiae bacterium]